MEIILSMATFVKFDKVFTNNRQIPIVVIVIMVDYGRIHSESMIYDMNISSN